MSWVDSLHTFIQPHESGEWSNKSGQNFKNAINNGMILFLATKCLGRNSWRKVVRTRRDDVEQAEGQRPSPKSLWQKNSWCMKMPLSSQLHLSLSQPPRPLPATTRTYVCTSIHLDVRGYICAYFHSWSNSFLRTDLKIWSSCGEVRQFMCCRKIYIA